MSVKDNPIMSQKEMPLMKTEGQYLFDDRYGIVRIAISISALKFQGEKENQINKTLYKKVGEHFIRISDFVEYFSEEPWDTTPLYIQDQKKQGRGYYGYYGYSDQDLRAEVMEKIQIEAVTIRVTMMYDYGTHRNGQESIEKDFTVTSKKELNNHKVFILDGFDASDLHWMRPPIGDIRVGNKYWIPGKGIVEITQVLDYPSLQYEDKDNMLFCEATTAYGANVKVYCKGIHCNDLYYLPYEKWNDPRRILNESKNEHFLFPLIKRDGNTINIWWRQVEDAASYTVSFYSMMDYCLYHLKDYTVDRNDQVLIVKGLDVSDLWYKIKAENRSGEVIAMTRGRSSANSLLYS